MVILWNQNQLLENHTCIIPRQHKKKKLNFKILELKRSLEMMWLLEQAQKLRILLWEVFLTV